MDEIDKAQQELYKHLSIALANHKQICNDERAIHTASNCIECGNEIASARQLAMPECQRCIYCAEKFEILTKRK